MEKLWFVFGVLAMFAAVGNVSTILTKRRAEGFRFASLSLTALTVCSFYSWDAMWVKAGDWAALEDVTPCAAGLLLVLVVASIFLNGITLFVCKEKKK